MPNRLLFPTKDGREQALLPGRPYPVAVTRFRAVDRLSSSRRDFESHLLGRSPDVRYLRTTIDVLPDRQLGRVVRSQYLRQESNLVLGFRKTTCVPAHSEDKRLV